ACRCVCIASLCNNIIACDQLSKCSILAIQKSSVCQANEELAACRIRILRSCHRNDSSNMRPLVKLSLHLVSRPSSPDHGIICFAQRIAALNHKAFYDPMESGAVVETAAADGLESIAG